MKTKTYVGRLVGLLSVWLLTMAPAHAVLYQVGDVFAAVASGLVNHYDSAGNLLATYDTTNGGFTTGMAFDASGNLYVTNFSANRLAQFDNAGNLLNANYVTTGLSTPESIVFDNSGNFFVGNLGSGIQSYDAAGNFLGNVINVRVDFFDLSADQSTFLYGQEGNAVLTVSNAIPGTPGPNFASGLTQAFAMRILPDGGLLVADLNDVKRFDAAGNLVQTYDAAGENTWFSLNLDPDGTSFWSGNFGTANIHRFDLATGASLFNFNTGTGASTLFGLAIFGEMTVGGPGDEVPEPGTLLLLGLGLAGLGLVRRRRA